MGKMPAFQWYPSDWMNDVELQSASPLSRGIWINALCRMFWKKERGKITGSAEILARLFNCNEAEFAVFLKEAQTLGFCEVSHNNNGDITLINRRMLRDDKERKNNRIRQKRYYEKHKPNGEPNRKITPPSSSSSSSSEKTHDCPHQKIIDLWHEILPELPRVKAWSKKRKGLLNARWKENKKRQNLDYWKSLFEYIRGSDFLMGKVKDFNASLPWILTEEKFIRVIEGFYDNKT